MSKPRATVRQEAGRLVHVEAPGCIVNVRYNLHDVDGRAVTSVQLLADSYSGEMWTVDMPGHESGFTVRVIEETP